MVTIALIVVRIMWLSLKLWAMDVTHHDMAVYEACVNQGKDTI